MLSGEMVSIMGMAGRDECPARSGEPRRHEEGGWRPGLPPGGYGNMHELFPITGGKSPGEL